MVTPPTVQSVPLITPSRLSQAEIEARFFRGLADPSRVRILELLLEGEKNVSELVE
ncbi:MAG: winged helix-turn-helix transcriptional regulator, partial [Chloroflexi bacterium]|nr:winged helix-turn-helix transcriptional regulator [Chloroflexota bacterium]